MNVWGDGYQAGKRAAQAEIAQLETALAATSAALEEALHWRAIAEDSARVCEGLRVELATLRQLARDVVANTMVFPDYVIILRAAFERLRDAVERGVE